MIWESIPKEIRRNLWENAIPIAKQSRFIIIKFLIETIECRAGAGFGKACGQMCALKNPKSYTSTELPYSAPKPSPLNPKPNPFF